MRSFALLAVLAACPAPRTSALEEHRSKGLVVLLVIDQLPEWAFELKQPALHGGFERLLSEGEWHVGRHPSAATLTAPGHALLGTGAPPAQSGILANEWWHRDLHRSIAAAEDEDGAPSAKWLRVPGLGDAVGGKAVAVSLKVRSSVLPLGHSGLPLFYDPKAAGWASPAAPTWLADWSRGQNLAARVLDVWTPTDASKLATLSGVADDQAGEVGAKGFGPTFPHDPSKTKDPADALFATPLGNDIAFDVATEAIQREQPRVLVISLSANDYVGHGWGHESWEAWDMMVRLDQRLGQFLTDLDRLVGANRWSMIVTSDHGASPLPDKIGGGRMTADQVRDAANHAASAVLGPGEWIDNAHFPTIYLSQAMLAQPKNELASATTHVLNALASFPGIERVGRVADYAGHCDTRTGVARTLCLTFDPERSGELFYMPANGWVMESRDEPAATAHGSLHDYDRLVPVIVVPPDRKPHPAQHAPLSGEIPMTDIAPMLRHWLGV